MTDDPTPEAVPLSRELVRAVMDGDKMAAQQIRETIEQLIEKGTEDETPD